MGTRFGNAARAWAHMYFVNLLAPRGARRRHGDREHWDHSPSRTPLRAEKCDL
jgi:hypothetical protein